MITFTSPAGIGSVPSHLVDFVVTFAVPVTVVCAMIPTMENVKRGVFDALQFPMTETKFCKYCYFTRDSWAAGRRWTVVTHIFCHADRNHLMSNMTSLWLYGLRVFQELGAFGT